MKPYYEDNYCTLYWADCRDVVSILPAVGLIITDPPYGTTNNAWDKSGFDYWPVFGTACNGHVLFSAQPYTSFLISGNPKEFCYEVIWRKSHATGHLNANRQPMRQHENICVFGGVEYHPQMEKKAAYNIRPHTKSERAHPGSYGDFSYQADRTAANDLTFPRSVVDFNCPNHGEKGLHPTQKPIELLRYLVATYSNQDTLILDPFAGSGTTARAAKDLGRKSISIEKEEAFCETIAKRLSQEVLSL